MPISGSMIRTRIVVKWKVGFANRLAFRSISAYLASVRKIRPQNTEMHRGTPHQYYFAAGFLTLENAVANLKCPW